MNSTSANYCLDMSRRSSLCPPHHENTVLSPPLTPALQQHHPFDKRQSADLTYSSNQYPRPVYPMDNYQHWMNHTAMQQQYHQQTQMQHHLAQQQLHSHHPSSIPTTQVHNAMTTIPQQQQPQQQQPQQQQPQQPQIQPQPQQQQPQQQPQQRSINEKPSSRKQPTKQNKHMCTYPDCFWSFKRYEHLKRHMLVHTGERPHVCPHPGCGKRFSRSDNFHAHYRTHEKKAMAKQKQQQRQQDTSSSTSTTSSVMTPTNSASSFIVKEEKEPNTAYMQPYYPNGFLAMKTEQPQQNGFISHDYPGGHYIEEQKKPHACTHQDCDKRFRRLEHLKRHMRIHTHEQPFKCNFPGCLKAFSRSDNLTQHKKTHERRSSTMNQPQEISIQQHFMHNNHHTDSFTFDFVRDNNSDHYHTTNSNPNHHFHDKQQHPIMGWQNPGDTTTESVGC